jgi:immunity protein 35 of polymorphic toxin system
MDVEEARIVAEEILSRTFAEEDFDVVINGEYEYDSAWVFSYDTRIYVETGDFSHALAGNGPLIIPKDRSEPWFATTARPLDEQVR